MSNFSVLDASGALAVLLGQPASAAIEPRLREDRILIAPDLYISEITNTAWKYARFTHSSEEKSITLVQSSLNLVDSFFPTSILWKSALQLAIHSGHPAYDCFYLALQQKMNAQLLTADKKLAGLARSLGLTVFGA